MGLIDFKYSSLILEKVDNLKKFLLSYNGAGSVDLRKAIYIEVYLVEDSNKGLLILEIIMCTKSKVIFKKSYSMDSYIDKPVKDVLDILESMPENIERCKFSFNSNSLCQLKRQKSGNYILLVN